MQPIIKIPNLYKSTFLVIVFGMILSFYSVSASPASPNNPQQSCVDKLGPSATCRPIVDGRTDFCDCYIPENNNPQDECVKKLGVGATCIGWTNSMPGTCICGYENNVMINQECKNNGGYCKLSGKGACGDNGFTLGFVCPNNAEGDAQVCCAPQGIEMPPVRKPPSDCSSNGGSCITGGRDACRGLINMKLTCPNDVAGNVQTCCVSNYVPLPYDNIVLTTPGEVIQEVGSLKKTIEESNANVIFLSENCSTKIDFNANLECKTKLDIGRTNQITLQQKSDALKNAFDSLSGDQKVEVSKNQNIPEVLGSSIQAIEKIKNVSENIKTAVPETTTNLVSETIGKGLVPCGVGSGSPCTLCHLVKGVQGVINWGMGVMTYFAVAVIVAMGILYIVSAGDSGMITMAKNGLKTTLIGFALMLGSWLIVNTAMVVLAQSNLGIGVTNWFEITCDTSSSAQQGGSGTITTPTGSTTGNASGDCSKYDSDFTAVAQSTGVDKCLLVGIAMGETTCGKNMTGGDGKSCGLMHILTSESGQTCQEQNNTPRLQIEKAAAKLQSNQQELNKYKGKFDIGNNYTQSGKKIQISGQGNSYDTGNDDLIASYNAGTGDRLARNPFHASADCPGAPAWQCPINAGNFDESTQIYVPNVQKTQQQCSQ